MKSPSTAAGELPKLIVQSRAVRDILSGNRSSLTLDLAEASIRVSPYSSVDELTFPRSAVAFGAAGMRDFSEQGGKML